MSFTKFGWFAAFMLPALVGCAGEGEERGGAAYPEAVGSDTPEQMAAASEVAPPAQPIQSQAEPPAPPPGQEVVVGSDGIDYADTDPSALTDFRSTLDPYGNWVEDPNYGTVWVPSPSVVGTDFAPYVTNGYWTYDNDYTWVSGYEWGWAPFHYGRWAYIGGTGWGWIPGRRYAGAWVGWRTGYDYYDGYVGWGPLAPSWYWRGGWAYGIGVTPVSPYVFCSGHDLFGPGVGGRIVTGGAVGAVAEHSRPYVPASPGVGLGGHTPASPGVGGPPPSQLHIPANQIAHTPINDRGLMHAQQFSRASSASALGARAPTQLASGGFGGNTMGNASMASHGVASGPHSLPGGAVAGHALLPRPSPTMPAYGARGGNSFSGPTRIGGGAGSYGGSYSRPAYGGPAYHSAPAYAGAGSSSFHGSSFQGPSAFSGGSTFHSSPSYSAPSTHFSSGGGGFSGGSHFSGGGGHGGGGRGGGHR